jgi:putative heme-binding domain-containing protein
LRALSFLFLAVAALTFSVPPRATAQAGHPETYAPADIALGARLYNAQCTPCHGANGDGIGGIEFRRSIFRTAVTDRDLSRVIMTGVPGKGMPAFKLVPSEVTGVIAYLRNFSSFDRTSVKIGDAARGRLVFEGKGACGTCHRVDASGPRFAPNLSDIGAVRGPGSLLRTLIDPSSQMMPINRPVRVVTHDGREINGRRLNEDTYSLQIIDEHENLLSLVKAELREYTISKTSPMPAYKERLTENERADVIAYLLTLKGAR